MKYCVVLENELSGSKMPPEIRIIHRSGGHTEKAHEEDDLKDPSQSEQLLHAVSESEV